MQDLPPKGGFEALPYRRHLPARGPSGAVLLTAVASVVLTGLCLSRRSTAIIQELEREKRQARLHLLPLLQAESDRKLIASEVRFLQLQEEAKACGIDAATRPVYHNRNNYIPNSLSI